MKGGGGQETDDYSQSLQNYRSRPDPYTLILLNRVSNYFVTGDDEKIAVILCIPMIHSPLKPEQNNFTTMTIYLLMYKSAAEIL